MPGTGSKSLLSTLLYWAELDSNFINRSRNKNRPENQTFLICYFSWFSLVDELRNFELAINDQLLARQLVVQVS